MDKSRLRVADLRIVRHQRTIIKDLSFDVFPGEVLGLIGPNGAGKSTVLAALAGIEKPQNGTVEIDGQDLYSLSSGDRAQHLSWVEQVGHVYWPLSVERIVMLGRIPHLTGWSRVSRDDLQAVEQALEQADCLSIRSRVINTLSGGERARVLLARALASRASILLADEPVSSLDLAHQLQTMQLLQEFASGSQAAVVVLHDLSLAVRYCNRLVLIDKGRCIAVGEPAAVLSHQNIAEVYGVSVITGCESVPWVVPEHLLR